jgi:hypothetical protein
MLNIFKYVITKYMSAIDNIIHLVRDDFKKDSILIKNKYTLIKQYERVDEKIMTKDFSDIYYKVVDNKKLHKFLYFIKKKYKLKYSNYYIFEIDDLYEDNNFFLTVKINSKLHTLNVEDINVFVLEKIIEGLVYTCKEIHKKLSNKKVISNSLNKYFQIYKPISHIPNHYLVVIKKRIENYIISNLTTHCKNIKEIIQFIFNTIPLVWGLKEQEKYIKKFSDAILRLNERKVINILSPQKYPHIFSSHLFNNFCVARSISKKIYIEDIEFLKLFINTIIHNELGTNVKHDPLGSEYNKLRYELLSFYPTLIIDELEHIRRNVVAIAFKRISVFLTGIKQKRPFIITTPQMDEFLKQIFDPFISLRKIKKLIKRITLKNNGNLDIYTSKGKCKICSNCFKATAIFNYICADCVNFLSTSSNPRAKNHLRAPTKT